VTLLYSPGRIKFDAGSSFVGEPQMTPIGAGALWVMFAMGSELVGGNNSLYQPRGYVNTTPVFSGSTQIFNVGGTTYSFDQTFIIDVSAYNDGHHYFIPLEVVASTGPLWLTIQVYDDVGGFAAGTPGVACCHDPMLDQILASVRKTY